MGKGRRAWFLAAAWAVAIFLASSIPGRSMPEVEVLRYDKVVHAVVYAVLGGLFFAAIRRSSSLTRGRVVAVAAVFAVVYGLTDELHQLFVPGRNAELNDALADGIGGLFGASIAAVLPFARPDGAG
jgi:VanZ family protein